jgi:D-glycero-D-manno-heptose 1,7-bisphosphate phosphatase
MDEGVILRALIGSDPQRKESIWMALVDGVGCWRSLPASPLEFAGRPAMFLDRDGVVVVEVGYLGRAEDVVLVDGAAEAIGELNRAGVPVIVVTNQAGVARGYYDWAGFEAVQREIEHRLGAGGAHFDAVLACAYHEHGFGALAVAGHPWRKPGPGMLLEAGECMGLDLGRSWIAGDTADDLRAGRTAGLAGGIHLATGHGNNDQRRAAEALAGASFEVLAAATVLDGVRRLGVTRLGAISG